MGIVKRNQLTDSRISGATVWDGAVEKMPEEGGHCPVKTRCDVLHRRLKMKRL